MKLLKLASRKMPCQLFTRNCSEDDHIYGFWEEDGDAGFFSSRKEIAREATKLGGSTIIAFRHCPVCGAPLFDTLEQE